MHNDDEADFYTLLLNTCAACQPSAKPLTPGAMNLIFDDLQPYSLDLVRNALAAHRRDPDRGQWLPSTAHIEHQIERRRTVQWVSADEAWGTAPKLETDSGVCNQVVAAALAAAQSLIDSGEMVAARRTFIDAYNARVEQAKNHPDPAQRVPITFVSGGNLPRRFDDAHGEHQMLLERAQSSGLLPKPRQQAAPQLESVKRSSAMPDLKALLLTLQPKEIPPAEAQDYE